MDTVILHIQPQSSEPIYRQIGDQIRRLVASGQLAPGTLLPSVRDVAGTYAINPMTVSKAYSQLETEGVLERLRGKGMAVASQTSAKASPDRWQFIDPALDAVVRQARELELDPDAVLQRLAQKLGTPTA